MAAHAHAAKVLTTAVALLALQLPAVCPQYRYETVHNSSDKRMRMYRYEDSYESDEGSDEADELCTNSLLTFGPHDWLYSAPQNLYPMQQFQAWPYTVAPCGTDSCYPLWTCPRHYLLYPCFPQPQLQDCASAYLGYHPSATSSVHFIQGVSNPSLSLHGSPQVAHVPLLPTVQLAQPPVAPVIPNHQVILDPPLPQPRNIYQQPGHNFLQTFDISALEPVPPRPVCGQPSPGCPPTKYRSFDGSCNNLKRTEWGMAGQRYGRLVRHKYGDGVQSPPTSVTGAPLPSARAVSLVLFPDVDIDDKRWTLITMQWGQIVTHDMSMAMGTTQSKPHPTKCCYPDGHAAYEEAVSPSCYPIILPRDDPIFQPYMKSCMNFVRSTTDLAQGCGSGLEPAEQLSTVTSYLDLSIVYGNSKQMADALRLFHGGRLISEIKNGREYPPAAANSSTMCDVQSPDEPCYQTGDVRANQNPQLTILQILLLREHNRIADILSKLNPHWSDEKLFQEARRINTAQYQHLTYYEWLPLFLGRENALRHGIIHKTDGHVDDYREDVDPSTLQGHATAAFRYFHSLIAGHLQLVQEDRQSYAALRFSDVLNRPGVIEEGTTGDDLARGLVTQPEKAADPFFTAEITNFLFRMGRPLGSDLRAIDIQRGRDHGLGSYNDYREFCGLRRAHSFSDFADQISPENIEKLAALYAHPEDVDYTVAGSLEKHVPGTEAGPTFLCLLMEQFYRTRVADRFFYESASNPHPFTPAQLAEIRKYTVSRLFCDNGDNIHGMQPRGFDLITPKNPVVSCQQYDAIPAIDLSLWQEYPHSADYSIFGK